jgi:large exoprotein involved in heme utilization and adhesion
VQRRLLLTDSAISAEAGGVTATDAGGNITIDPEYVILNASDIVARANAGNGGNITIQAGFFIASGDSAIDASSTSGIDGNVLIDSPNEIMGSVLPLEAPAVVGAIVTQSCLPRAAEQRSTLTLEARHAPTAIAGEFLPSPPAEGAVANAVPAC